MSNYRIAQICENGDLITDSADVFPDECRKHCVKCGARTISVCPSCNASILGVRDDYPDYENYHIPYYCHECGTPYPWTSKILDGAVEILALDTDLDPKIKEIVKEAIPGLIIDSPLASVAAAKYATHIPKASELVRNSLHNLLIDLISESAKKILLG